MAASKSPADKASKKGFTGLKDMFDGGGMGGSGASYSSLSNEDYKRAGGKDYQEGMRRGGWTEFDQQGQGRTLRGPQAMMANPFFGGLLGLATGGASGAMMGLGGTMVRNDIRQKGGLGGLLGKQGGVAQQAAIAPILAPATSMRPQPRPQMMSPQAMPQDFYGLSGNPAMQAPFHRCNLTLHRMCRPLVQILQRQTQCHQAPLALAHWALYLSQIMEFLLRPLHKLIQICLILRQKI